jgi:hypothetical protein
LDLLQKSGDPDVRRNFFIVKKAPNLFYLLLHGIFL